MDKYIIDIYGAENLNKVKTNSKNGREESRRRFVKKYPYADLDKFEFQVNLKKNGDIDKYIVYYKINDTESYDITSNTFLNNREWMKHLYWQEPWGIRGTVQPYVRNPVGTQYKINSFRVCVTNDLFFDIDLPDFNIVDNEDINNNYLENTFFVSLFAAYVATYTCGISTRHLEYNSKTPKIITSIARYHLYYHMRRFIRQPSRIKRFITKEMKRIIERNRPVDYEWTSEFHQGQENVGSWVSTQPRGTIRNARPVFSKNGVSGQIGISYQKRGERIVKPYEDYKVFISTRSNGLTKTGQLLFQQSVESYVYCVLGAQASTRWPIVGRGAMSIQTQSVFLKKVEDTIIQDDQTVAIRNMRTAISDTNVVLNIAISPGMILIPSSMIILTEMIPGYNNILTIAKSGMRFGVNDAVNYLKVDSSDNDDDDESTSSAKPQSSVERLSRDKEPTEDKRKIPKNSTIIVSGNPNDSYRTDIYLLIITLIGGSMVSRYII